VEAEAVVLVAEVVAVGKAQQPVRQPLLELQCQHYQRPVEPHPLRAVAAGMALDSP
jgi:hypothetical protein